MGTGSRVSRPRTSRLWGRRQFLGALAASLVGVSYSASTAIQDYRLPNQNEFRQVDLFVGGQDGYHTFRIPALVVSNAGTILVFSEGRLRGSGDAGEIHVVLRRSPDQGKTWRDLQLVVADRDRTCGNPCPVVDQTTGTIWLLFCKNAGDGGEHLVLQGRAQRTVWLTWSSDDGVTWAKPVEITRQVKLLGWTWYATGPGHGIQLKSGRLVIPCNHVVGRGFNSQDPQHSHVIFSDDHGATWNIGGSLEAGTDESTIVERVDGILYVNARNQGSTGILNRAFAWSRDGGNTFSPVSWDRTLVDPICQASLVRFTDRFRHDKNRILFSNPASFERERVTVRLSYDECLTWNVGKVLYPGPSAYSDLAIAPDRTICCCYERGEKKLYQKVTFAQFGIEWLTDGADQLEVPFDPLNLDHWRQNVNRIIGRANN